jgi:hypothetical protein
MNMKRIGMILVPYIFLVAVAAGCVEAAPSRAEIVSLIDQLVSPNTQPKADGPDAIYPNGFDKAAQGRVHKAFRKLTEIGLPAFPYLQARLGDKRYCFTMDAGPADANFSVGHVCELIIDGHLQPCGYFTRGVKDKNGQERDPRTRSRRPSYFEHFKLDKSKTFESWWNFHKSKSMRDIQIEVLEWIVVREKRNPEDYSENEIAYLKTMLAKLRKSDLAIPPYFPFSK